METNTRTNNQLKTSAQEFADLARQLNLEVDSDDVQELLDSHKKELTMDELIAMHEQDIDELESLNPVQLEHRMTVGNLTEGLFS
ncbi:hypothetical protein TNCV_1338481 [Trichonephila clavipes]|nr:hypothetical protein TNCV_1338481 [Trichonephila clavipes]